MYNEERGLLLCNGVLTSLVVFHSLISCILSLFDGTEAAIRLARSQIVAFLKPLLWHGEHLAWSLRYGWRQFEVGTTISGLVVKLHIDVIYEAHSLNIVFLLVGTLYEYRWHLMSCFLKAICVKLILEWLVEGV